jgi:uncharacterized protein (TIGR00106 family)
VEIPRLHPPQTDSGCASRKEERNVLAELRVTPIGSRTSFARLIADLVPVLAESPLQYQVHAMRTTLEGDLEPILELVRRSHEEAQEHANRVLIELSIDDRTRAEGEIVRTVSSRRREGARCIPPRLCPPSSRRARHLATERETIPPSRENALHRSIDFPAARALHGSRPMAEPSGHTLLTGALRVINRAIDMHRKSSPWREVVARTSGPRGPRFFAVEVCEGDPERIVDHYTIRAHGGRLEMVEHGRSERPIDWRVSVEALRSIVVTPDRYLSDPRTLPLDWLELRLGIRARPKRTAGWRIGRARRPSK